MGDCAFGGGCRPPALWIGHGMGGEHVVGAHVAVVVADVVAEALPDAVEHRRIHDQTADIAREVVGRPAEQAVRPRGDAPMGLEPALQILARARQQEVGREMVPVLLECHHIAVLGRALAVVDHGEGVRRVAERRMGRDVLDQFAADIDAPAVADALEIVLAGHQHGAGLLTPHCLVRQVGAEAGARRPAPTQASMPRPAATHRPRRQPCARAAEIHGSCRSPGGNRHS